MPLDYISPPGTGGGSPDNMGNHTASQDLVLGGFGLRNLADVSRLGSLSLTDGDRILVGGSRGGEFVYHESGRSALGYAVEGIYFDAGDSDDYFVRSYHGMAQLSFFDTSADVAPAIQHAVDFGIPLQMARGAFSLGSSISVNGNATIIGSGRDTTSLVWTGTNGGEMMRFADADDSQDASTSTRHLWIQGFELDGDDIASVGFRLGDGDTAFASVGGKISDCRSVRMSAEGFALDASQIFTLARCEAESCSPGFRSQVYGTAIPATNTTTVFDQCRAINNNGVGFEISQGSSFEFRGCVSEQNDLEGMILQTGSQAITQSFASINIYGLHLEQNNESRGAGTYGQLLIRKGPNGTAIPRSLTIHGLNSGAAAGSAAEDHHHVIVENGEVTLVNPVFAGGTPASIHCPVNTSTCRLRVATDDQGIDSDYITFAGNAVNAIVESRYYGGVNNYGTAIFGNVAGNISLMAKHSTEGLRLEGNDLLTIGRTVPNIVYASDNDDTPSVSIASVLVLDNSATTTVSDFDFGSEGQIVNVVCQDSNTSITGSNFDLKGVVIAAMPGGWSHSFILIGEVWTLLH